MTPIESELVEAYFPAAAPPNGTIEIDEIDPLVLTKPAKLDGEEERMKLTPPATTFTRPGPVEKSTFVLKKLPPIANTFALEKLKLSATSELLVEKIPESAKRPPAAEAVQAASPLPPLVPEA